MSPAMAAELSRLGVVVLLVKKPETKAPAEPPREKAWTPSFKGEEPPL